MTFRREAGAIMRDRFDPNAPGDYAAPDSAARAVLDTFAGTEERLYDLRYPGPLESYQVVSRHEEIAVIKGAADFVLRHKVLEHCLQVEVRVKLLSGTVTNVAVADVVTTFMGRAMYDPQDRGALENYYWLSRSERDGATVMEICNRHDGHVLEIAIRVHSVPAEQAYRYALDQDEIWRKHGLKVYDERHPQQS